MTTKDISVWAKKNPFTAVCCGLSVLLVAGYFFRQGGVPEAESLLAERATKSDRLKTNITHSALLKEHVASLEDASGKIQQRLMHGGDLAKNQQYFYKIETETGVKLIDLRPGGSVASGAAKPAAGPKKLYAAVPYTCTVQGTHSQLLAFLRKLEQGEHFARFLSATLNVGAGGGEDEASAPDPNLSLTLGIEFLGQS